MFFVKELLGTGLDLVSGYEVISLCFDVSLPNEKPFVSFTMAQFKRRIALMQDD